MLVHELAEPYPLTDVQRSETLDRLYRMSGSDSREERARRVQWAKAAGGDVNDG